MQGGKASIRGFVGKVNGSLSGEEKKSYRLLAKRIFKEKRPFSS